LQIRKILEAQPNIDVQEQYSDVSPQRQGEISPRLYRTTTRYWLQCEAMRLAKIFTYSRQPDENKIRKKIFALCFGGNSVGSYSDFRGL
jgi:hypothetical protein